MARSESAADKLKRNHGSHEYLQAALQAGLFNLDQLLGVAEGTLPVTPRAWRIRERGKQGSRAAG